MFGSAMDEAMTDSGGLRKVELRQGVQHGLHRRRVVREVATRFRHNGLVRAADLQSPVWQANTLDRSLNEQRLLPLVESIEGRLYRRRSAVKAQNNVIHYHWTRPPP